MTREIKYTANNFGIGLGEDDCSIAPEDPIHEFARTGNLAVLDQKTLQPDAREAYLKKLELAKEQGIKPGSPAWFLL